MLFKRLNKSEIKNILVISLTNIGDVFLTLPVVDILREECPEADLSVVISPKGETLLKNNPHFKDVFVFDKHQSLIKSCRFILKLRSCHFDLIVDLRNTAIPLFLGAQHITPFYANKHTRTHMRLQHMDRLKTVFPYSNESPKKHALYFSEKEKEYVNGLIKEEIGENVPYVVIAPSAEDQRKRWYRDGFAALADHLIEVCGYKVVFVGKKQDYAMVEDIIQRMKHAPVNLSGTTTLAELGYLMRKSCLAVANDSGPMHMASYLDVPVLAFLGRSNPKVYGPWGKTGFFIKADESQITEDQGESCFMWSISIEQVLATIKEMKACGVLP